MSRRALPTTPLCLVPLLCLACGGGGDGNGDAPPVFVIRNTPHATLADTPLVSSDQYLAYLAVEATTGMGGTDLNGDTDVLDAVPAVKNMNSGSTSVVGAAVDLSLPAEETLLWDNHTLFLVVDEGVDDEDWTLDLDLDDRVLLCWGPGDTQPTFVAELSGSADPVMLAAGGRIYYVGADAPSATGESDLFYVDVANAGTAPGLPVRVATNVADSGANGVRVTLLGQRAGLVFATLDETLEGVLNGDALADDTSVLALLDGRDAAGVLLNAARAVPPNTPLAARRAGGTYLAAFLVDEAAEGVNLNAPGLFSPAWQPAACSLVDDVDTNDDVLFWVDFEAFEANAMTGAPTNTGLVGGGWVYVIDGFVGTLSLESSEGSGAGCDLNGDGDQSDRIFRWVAATTPVLPPTDPAKLLALAIAVPGGTGGVLSLQDDKWVVLVDEGADGRNHDGRPGNRDLLALHDPDNAGTGWNFDQGGSTFAGVSWMAADPSTSARFLGALTEDSLDVDLNGDSDKTDSVPTFPFEADLNQLDFPGLGVAVEPGNAGIVTARGVGFYRVSEAAEGIDINGDSDMADHYLQRLSLSGSFPAEFMGPLNNVFRSAVTPGPGGQPFGVAWVANEAMVGAAGVDLNGDGDGADLVVRWSKFP